MNVVRDDDGKSVSGGESEPHNEVGNSLIGNRSVLKV